jgi:hypothetical protein
MRVLQNVGARLACALALFLAAALPLAAQPRVGEVVLARNDVRGTPAGGATATLAEGSAVLLDMRVETGTDSAAKMTFDPQGALTLGAEADVTFTRAEVDQITGESRSWFEVLLGKVRLALSPSFRGEVDVETPVATLGVKGTDVRVEVNRRGRTVVEVLEGVVAVTAAAGGPEVTVSAGRRTVVEPGGRPTPPALLDPLGGTLSPSAGGPPFTVPQEDLEDSPADLFFGDLPIDRRPQSPSGNGPP